MSERRTDLFPFVLILVLFLLAFLVFLSIIDMVIIGATVAVVLIPFRHRIGNFVNTSISAAVVTLVVFVGVSAVVLFSYYIFASNIQVLLGMFDTIGTWLNNPSTNPLDFGVPVTKATLSGFLNEGTEVFIDYQQTLLNNLTLIAFKTFVFFFTLFSLLVWRGPQIPALPPRTEDAR